MKLKIIISIILMFISLTPSRAQTEITVKFNKSEKAIHASNFRFFITNYSDTIPVFNLKSGKENTRSTVFIPLTTDSLTGVFEYVNESKKLSTVDYSFKVDTTNLKRIKINLAFSINDSQTEFLRDFTVDKFYKTNAVSIKSGELKVGSQPVFTLTNNSDTVFYGVSMTNHFYGKIRTKTDYGWREFSGSYCASTIPEKPLTKFDTVYSWIPNYFSGDEYTIKRTGIYKYVVPLALEQISDGISMDLITNGQTRKRTRIFYEVGTEFTVE